MTTEQSNLIRQSLLNSIFADYNKLIATLKSLPIDNTATGLLKAISYIDDGIVWAKEVILNAEILLTSVEAPVVPDAAAQNAATE